MLLGAGVRRQVRDAAWVQVYAGSILLNAYAAHSRQKPVDVCRADARTWLHISGSGCLQLRWHLRVPSGAKACDGIKTLVVKGSDSDCTTIPVGGAALPKACAQAAMARKTGSDKVRPALS